MRLHQQQLVLRQKQSYPEKGFHWLANHGCHPTTLLDCLSLVLAWNMLLLWYIAKVWSEAPRAEINHYDGATPGNQYIRHAIFLLVCVITYLPMILNAIESINSCFEFCDDQGIRCWLTVYLSSQVKMKIDSDMK